MKKFTLALIFVLMLTAPAIFAATPAPSNQNAEKKATDNAGMATFTGSLMILMSVGIGYAARKIYLIRSLGKEEI